MGKLYTQMIFYSTSESYEREQFFVLFEFHACSKEYGKKKKPELCVSINVFENIFFMLDKIFTETLPVAVN